jgi:hypothetical protein
MTGLAGMVDGVPKRDNADPPGLKMHARMAERLGSMRADGRNCMYPSLQLADQPHLYRNTHRNQNFPFI